MKIAVNSDELKKCFGDTFPAATISLLSAPDIKQPQKSLLDLDCIFLMYDVVSTSRTSTDTLALLTRFAAEIPQTPVFVLDNCFSLTHHNTVTGFPNVIGYGRIDHPITLHEITNNLSIFHKYSELKTALRNLPEEQIKKLGWSISIDPENFFADPYADKLYLGEMRSFINDLKRLTDKLRPAEFTPDYTDDKPMLDWLEMWHAHKLGATHYPDPNTGQQKAINPKEIKEAAKLFETKRTNPKVQHILIHGETGAGKTFIAHFIHNYFYRTCKKEWQKKSPTIVSCPELQGNLAVPTLFGCLAGSWTDSRTRVGYLLESYNGTLFLDEIGAASPGIQEKLLHYLDHQNFRPDGWSLQEGIYVPLLVVAATKENLRGRIKDGRFREDLYYRFTEIEIPPLRACKDYIDVYIDCELQNPRTNDGAIDAITTDAIDVLKKYDYPGNFREFHRILSLAVEEAKSMRIRTIAKDHIETAMTKMRLT